MIECRHSSNRINEAIPQTFLPAGIKAIDERQKRHDATDHLFLFVGSLRGHVHSYSRAVLAGFDRLRFSQSRENLWGGWRTEVALVRIGISSLFDRIYCDGLESHSGWGNRGGRTPRRPTI